LIPLHLVTGFLGAGKTTFINRLLRDPALGDTLVVVNEFGAVGLDHRLYETLAGDVVLLASGCLCCELRGDFAQCLAGVLARREAGEMAFRRLVVETSGLADPAPILHAVFADADLAAKLRLAGVVALVDAVNGLDTLARHGEARRQVALADRMALSKSDLVGSDAALRARLAEMTPAPIYDLARGEMDAETFLAETPRPALAVSPRAAHGSAQAHAFRAARPVDAAAFARFLDLLAALAGPRLLRVKGLVATSDAPERPWLVQGAQHAFAPPLRLAAWPEGPRETTLVVIGEGIGASAERLWSALTGEIAPDAPDWAAVAQNPLSLRAGGLLG
jgi:G3E family GTPase